MKTWIAGGLFLATATLAGTALWTGCSSDTSGPPKDGGTIQILWAEWQPADALQRLCTQHYTTLTGVKIKVVQKPWKADGFPAAKQKEFNTNGTTYDIIIGDSQWLGQGVAGGHYEDLTDLVKGNPELFKDVAPAAMEYYCEYPKGAGRYYAVPCESDAMAIAYRKDLFEDTTHRERYALFAAQELQKQGSRDSALAELKPPQTWEHLLLIARYFKEKSDIPNMAGIVMPTTAGYDQGTMSYECLLWSFGGDWGDQAKYTVAIDTPASVAALAFMKKLVDASSPQGPNMDYGDVQQTYASGKAAMALTYFAFFPQFNSPVDNATYYKKTGYCNVPAGPAGKRFTALGGQGMSVNARISPDRKERTRKFLAWFSSQKTQQKWAVFGGFSANSKVLEWPEFQKLTPYNRLFPEAFASMKDFWNIPEYDQLLQSAQTNISLTLEGKKTPEEAVKAVQAEHEKILKSRQKL